MMSTKNFSLRIDDELLFKLYIIADNNNRSVNGQILHLIKIYISQYEKANGTIKNHSI